MSLSRRSLLLLLPLTLTFCAKPEAATPAATASPAASSTAPASPPAAAAAPAPVTAGSAAAASTPAATGIATADPDVGGVTVTVKELKRTSGGTLSLKFAITNSSGKDVRTGYNYGDPDHQIRDYDSVGGVTLLDAVGKKKYFVARDSEGKCVCSQGFKDIAPGATSNGWAKFPAPPDDVQKISVVIPHFSPMDDVPISK
jgi:Cu/Ag efflux protein CusF